MTDAGRAFACKLSVLPFSPNHNRDNADCAAQIRNCPLGGKKRLQ
jgi:hypothetical protein